jgi:hypothetical protein
MSDRDQIEEPISVDGFIKGLKILKKEFCQDEGVHNFFLHNLTHLQYEKQLDELYLSTILDFLVTYSAQGEKFRFLSDVLVKIADKPGALTVHSGHASAFHIDNIVLSLMSRMTQITLSAYASEDALWKFAIKFAKRYLSNFLQSSTYIQLLRKMFHSIQVLPQGNPFLLPW